MRVVAAVPVPARVLIFSALALLAAALTPLAVAQDKKEAAPASTDTLWKAAFKDLDGKAQPFEQWKGKTIVVYFWATWCAPCHKEAPHLSKIYEANKDKGLVIVGIALDNADKVREFVGKHKLTNQIVYAGTEGIQLGRDLGNSLGAIPFTVVIDKEGKIVETLRGDTPDGKIEAILAPLLG